MIGINIPKRIKAFWDRINKDKLRFILEGQKALLEKMSISTDADVLDRAVLKRGKKWEISIDLSIIDADVNVEGEVSFAHTIYDPEFDVVVSVVKKQFMGLRKFPLGKVRVRGKFPSLRFHILEKKEGVQDIDLQKYAAFSLIPAVNYAIYRPVALEVLKSGTPA